jgi:hypothetical protein
MAGQVPTGLNPAAAAALAQQQLQAILSNPMIPRFYGNTFGIAQTSADLSVIVVANSAAAGILTMSYSSAKGLIAELEKAVRNFETATGQAVLTNQELDAKMKPVMESGNAKV